MLCDAVKVPGMYVSYTARNKTRLDQREVPGRGACTALYFLSNLASEVISHFLFMTGQVQDSDRITVSLE